MKGRITLIFFISCFLCCPIWLLAQQLTVTGKVTSKTDGSPLPGVTVIIQGTRLGTSTDGTGSFKLTVPRSGSVLVFSQIGMQTQTVVVRNSAPLSISLVESASSLSEVVVVGYGTQKKSVVTGAISGVKGADLENQQISRVEQALQGRASGITIATASGAPGSSATVRVRGITSLNNNANNPLYVVDGVVVDVGGIDYLNQADIESIEVLKDAASAAIYGARSAGGVILITTKKGKAGSVRLNYSGYYGTQAPAKRLDLLNASQYATLRNEAAINGGGSAVYQNPNSLGIGTDWQDVLFNDNAAIQNHEVSLSGGSDRSTFYTSYGYFDQQGIVATDISNYKRNNIRINSTHKVREWVTIGENVGYSHIRNQGSLNTNSEFGGPLSSAINLDPLTPVVITDPAVANSAPYSTQAVVRDANGNPYGISQIVQQEMTNPLAYIQTRRGNYSWSDNIVGNAFVELEPIKGLRFRSTLGSKLAYWGDESFTPIYYLNAATTSTQTAFTRNKNQVFNWNVENTLSYSKKIEKHNFSILLGQGAYSDNNSTSTSVTFNNIAASTFDEASFNLKVPSTSRVSDASDGIEHTISSLFGRVTYDYGEKYLFTGIIRRDGSSRFGSNNKYGYFPSASIGWVATNESFWPENKVVNFLKIRGSYGVTGNDEMDNFKYLATVGANRNYVFGQDNLIIGYSPDAPANPDLKWEETSQLNFGFDASIFQNWSVTFDWFNKKTSGILRPIDLPGYFGFTGRPTGNVADMKNQGVELELGFKKQLGDFRLDLRANGSYVTNEVTNLGTNLGVPIEYINDWASSIQNMNGNLQRTSVGQPFNYYYGFKTNGIFQNQSDVTSYVNSAGKVIQPNAKPGDFRWKDINDDGAITDDDRTYLGTAIPKWSFGLTFNTSWKNFDMMIFGQGVAGNKIFQGLRRLDIPTANWSTKALGRWTGEGSTNSYPRLSTSDPNYNFSNPSDFYLESGNYFRIKTLQVGYTFKKALIQKVGLQNARIYVSSNNLVTFTKYSGFDPEIGGNPDIMGVDTGIYPQARSFLFGVNIGF